MKTTKTMHCVGGLQENGAADAVESGEIDDGVEHEDVFVAHVLPDLSRSERADHHFRDTERQRPHRQRCNRCPRRPAETEHAGNVSLRVPIVNDVCRAEGRRRHRFPAVGKPPHFGERRARGGENFLARDVCVDSRIAETSRIDEQCRHTEREEPIAYERGLGGFGVECGEEKDGHGARFQI